jgi:rhamnosyltransferase
MTKSISIVILTLNAGSRFEKLLAMIRAQIGDFDLELIVVDSGSTDGTVEMAKSHGARVHSIPKSEFNHGATRNLGVSLSTGEFVVLVVQDAVPLDEHWLSAMVEAVRRDELVAGVYGRQVPHPEAGVLTKALVGNLASSSSERREQFAGSPEEYRSLPPARRRRLAAFDNVSSCVRRSVWEKLPFDETNFGEDIRWGKKVVEAGHKIVYEPRSTVFHSHERGAMYDLKRYYVDQRVLMELFGLKPVPNLARLAMAIPRSSIYLFRLLRRNEELAATGALVLALLAVKYAVPAQVGNYLGAKSAAIARVSPRAFTKMHRFLSKGV